MPPQAQAKTQPNPRGNVQEVNTKLADAAMSGRGVLVWARRGFGYDHELDVDRGQVFKLRGHINDEKLLRLGYVEEFSTSTASYTCAECGMKFVGVLERAGHGKERHRNRNLTPHEEDSQADSRERRENEMAPLYLDKTEASQKG